MLRPAILLTWVGLLAVLGYRTWSASAVRTEPPAVSDTPAGASEEWMGVYQGSHKIGYTQQSVVPDGDGYRFAQRSVLRLSVLGRRRRCTRSRRGRRIITGPCAT